jgi:hypothetical protein
MEKRTRLWLAVSVVALASLGAWVWHIRTQWQEANQHRGEMYQRTLETVRSVCVNPKPGVESYCRDQALLLLEFPECDPECVALARKVRGEPTR